MKKLRLIMVFVLMLVALACVGCTNEATMSINEQGQGSYVMRYELPKNMFENDEYAKVKSLDELVNKLQSLYSADYGLVFEKDTTSSVEYDYIYAKVEYNSMEEFNKKMTALINYEEQNIVEQYQDSINTFNAAYIKNNTGLREGLVKEIEEYLTVNGVHIDVTSRNGKKFIKIIEDALDIVIDEYPYTLLKNKKDEQDNVNESLEAKIVYENNETKLYVPINYVYKNMVLLTNSIAYILSDCYDFDNGLVTYNNEIIQLHRTIYRKTMEDIELADVVKQSIRNAYGMDVTDFSIDKVSSAMAVDMLSGETEKKISECYPKNIEDLNANYPLSKFTKIFSEGEHFYENLTESISTNIVFADTKVKFNFNDLYSYGKEYIEIIKGKGENIEGIDEISTSGANNGHFNNSANTSDNTSSVEVASNNKPASTSVKAQGKSDNTPKTEDAFKVAIIVLLVISAAVLVVTSVKMYKVKKH